MADWTPIGNGELVSDQPITESLLTRLRDNPIAMIERASGAPTYGWAVTSTGSNANGYYRVWDDGYIEQWFRTDKGSADRVTITYPLAFTDAASISVVISDRRGIDNGGSDSASHLDGVNQLTSFTVSAYTLADVICWRAGGY